MHSLSSFKQEFDALLAERFDAHASEFLTRAHDEEITELVAQTRAILLSGGKRVRPYLVYCMHAALQSDTVSKHAVLRVGVAVELFHIFALIHDDITDRGRIRHGEKTLQIFLQEKLGSHINAMRVAEGQAILLGDVVHAWSRAELMSALPDTLLRPCLELFDAMTNTVVIGQMLDVRTLALTDAPPELIEKKTLLKTAHYTVVNPLQLGALLAYGNTEEIPEEHKQWVIAFGEALGMAFQLQDDLLDLTGSNSSYGKSTLVDVREGQHTSLTTYIKEHSSPEDRATFDSYFGSSARGEAEFTEHDVAALRTIIGRSGVEAYAHERITSLFGTVDTLLTDAPGNPEPWVAFVDMLRNRVH